jgi:hypothetical protein
VQRCENARYGTRDLSAAPAASARACVGPLGGVLAGHEQSRSISAPPARITFNFTRVIKLVHLARVSRRGLFSEHRGPCGRTAVTHLVCYFGGRQQAK